MSVNENEFKDLRIAVDKALAHFETRPAEPGFDRDVYDELRRVRETLLRGRRDLRDTNVKRDTPSPSGS